MDYLTQNVNVMVQFDKIILWKAKLTKKKVNVKGENDIF